MPIYDYQCSECAHIFDRFEAMNSTPTAHCPECASLAHRVMSKPGPPDVKDGTPIHHTRAPR